LRLALSRCDNNRCTLLVPTSVEYDARTFKVEKRQAAQRARDEELARFAAAEAHFFDDHKPLGLELSHYALAVDPERLGGAPSSAREIFDRSEHAPRAAATDARPKLDIRVASAEDLKVFPQF
jgi:hypothetical protein